MSIQIYNLDIFYLLLDFRIIFWRDLGKLSTKTAPIHKYNSGSLRCTKFDEEKILHNFTEQLNSVICSYHTIIAIIHKILSTLVYIMYFLWYLRLNNVVDWFKSNTQHQKMVKHFGPFNRYIIYVQYI